MNRVLLAFCLCFVSSCFLVGCSLDTAGDILVLLFPIYSIPDLDLLWTKDPGFFTTLLLGTHRSALTHSCILIFILSMLLQKLRFLGKLFTFFIGAIFAFHFLMDLFPSGYQGGLAYMHFPIVGSLTWIPLDGNIIPWLLSKAWLISNLVLCLYIPFIGDEPAKKEAASVEA